jgi:hypothetical protein
LESPEALADRWRGSCARGDDVAGLIRRPEQSAGLAEFGADGRIGDLTKVSAQELADLIGPVDT